MVTIKPIGRRDLKHIVSMLESDLPEQPSLLMPFLDSLRRMIVPIYQLNEWLPLPLKHYRVFTLPWVDQRFWAQ